MITPSPWRCRIHVRRLIAVALLPAIALALALVGLPGGARADRGRWTPPANWAQGDQARYAVHMMLLRGDNNPYHSRILWFEGENTFPPAAPIFEGGEWLWKPVGDTCTCATYPIVEFDSLGVDSCITNPFCSGHSVLGDGRLFVAGGDDSVVADYGVISARLFSGGTGTARGSWSDPGNMRYRRYYPTVTTLRDGRALVTSGGNYRQHRIWGGVNAANALTDTLRRFSPIPTGSWDQPVVPGGAQIPRRSGHTAVQMEYAQPFGGDVYFGGRDANNQPLQDIWVLSRQNDYLYPLLADAQYSWSQPTPLTGGPPLQRSDHSAILAFPVDTSMVIFGGRGQAQGQGYAAFNDVWRFFFDWRHQPQTYTWSRMFPTEATPGATPSPRFGHSAIYDETIDSTGAHLKRMIVFGGDSIWNQSPIDSKVYELRFDTANPGVAQWHVMTQVAVGNTGTPTPRYWHTMNADNAMRTIAGPIVDTCHVALMYGGKIGASSCSNELWKLWIFRSGRVGWEKVVPGGTSPGPRARHSTVLDPGQSGNLARIYVYGGVDGSGSPTDSKTYAFDPWGVNFVTWRQWSDLGISLAGHTSVLEHDQESVRVPEIFDPAGPTWASQTSATLWEQLYPPVFLVPGGGGGKSRLINLGFSGEQAYSLDIPPAGQAGSWTANGSTGFYAKTGVQYLPGRLMVTGGETLNAYVTGLTRTFDSSNLNNPWVPSDSMAKRFNPNLVLLPTGKVLAVGGNQVGESDSPVMRPQMWDPDANGGAGVWSSMTVDATRLAAQNMIRGYHSTAILLPDGRVLSAGGSDAQYPPSSDQHTGEIFCPPYPFQTDGTTLALRPTFSNAAKPESLGFGKIFTICVPDTTGLTRACLIRPGATTHAIDMNERYVPLIFAEVGNPMRLLVTSPASPDSAPPGDYLLFLTGKITGTTRYPDVPSIAQWVRIGAAGLDSCDVTPPQAITDLDFTVDPIDCTLFHLSWTAPADDGNLPASGPAKQYEIKISSSTIPSNWIAGTPLSQTPGSVGTPQTLDVTVGAGLRRYYRIKTRDDNNKWSDTSNEISISGPPPHSNCLGGGGMFAGGGGLPPGSRMQPAAVAASGPSAAAISSGENTLLNGAALGTRASDLLRLSPGTAAGTYSVRVREASLHAAALDNARLLTVDHSATVQTFMPGGRPVLGNRVAPVRATDGAGNDVTVLVNGSGTGTFLGDSGSALTVQLRTDSLASPDPVMIEASGLGSASAGILLQVPDSRDGWRTLEHYMPRLYFDELAVDSVAASQVRLLFLGSHQVRFVGRVARSGEQPTVQSGQLLSAQSSRLGNVLPTIAAIDTAAATLAGPDTLMLSFSVPPLSSGQVRECFLAVGATPLSPQGLAALPLRASGVESGPIRFALRQNQPNPFSGRTTISFELPVGAMVRLEVFDLQGRQLNVLTNHYYPAGYQSVTWDHRGTSGDVVRPGVYLYRLIAGSFRDQRKMVLLP